MTTTKELESLVGSVPDTSLFSPALYVDKNGDVKASIRHRNQFIVGNGFSPILALEVIKDFESGQSAMKAALVKAMALLKDPAAVAKAKRDHAERQAKKNGKATTASASVSDLEAELNSL